MARTPEVIVVDSKGEKLLQELTLLARLMDSAFRIPGTELRIGVDGLLGFIPGIGDIVGTAVSLYIIFRAQRYGLPKAVVGRMVINTGIDFFIGLFPIVGDLFDFAWKANEKNLGLIERYAAEPLHTTRSSQGFFLAIGLVFAACIGCIVYLFTLL